MGCTVTGTVIDSAGDPFTGEIVIAPAPPAARVSDDSVVRGVALTVEVDAGALTVDLEPGYYWVRVPDTRQFKINVPDTATIDIKDIVVSGVVNVDPPEIGIPAGGDAGQVLAKSSGDDYDAEWTTPSGGGAGSGDVVGPETAVSGNLAAFSGETGKLISDSGYAPSAFALSSHQHSIIDVFDAGGAASLNVGTSAGTVAAGDDARLSDSRTPTSHQLDGLLHSVSGLTAGHFLKATGATTFAFGEHGLSAADVSAAKQAQVDIYDTPGSYTWTKPAGAVAVCVVCVGGGGGGGSGARRQSGVATSGGGGGAGGSCSFLLRTASLVGASESVVVGGGGAGGASVSTDTTNGLVGLDGSGSTFGNVRAYPGKGAAGGGTSTTGTTTGNVGMFRGMTGGGSNVGTVGFTAVNGSYYCGCGGGGGGGGITSTPAFNTGGNGGLPDVANLANALKGDSDGAHGGAGTDFYPFGLGGAGGASSVSGAAGNGGNGGWPGGAGGGGGCSLDGSLSGAGGNGAGGCVVVVTYF